MLTRLSPHSLSLPNLRAEHGVSMIELLVAMASATVVTAATVTVLAVAYNQETRTTDHTQANQIGRTAMNSIITELNSSCTGRAPIQEGKEISELGLKKTNATNLWLISVYGKEESGNAVLKTATEQDIHWTETGISNTEEKLGTLTDYEFASKTGEDEDPEQWTFALEKANVKKRILSENVIPLKVNGESTIFQYAQYENGALKQIASTSFPLSAATADKVSKVTIAFKQAPEDADTRGGRFVDLANSVNLRLDPSESTSEGPCE